MDVIIPWLTPAVMLAIFAWLRLDIRDLARRIDRIEKRFDDRADKTDKRIDDFAKEVNMRFDGVTRELLDLRERMAKLEGWLERDRLGAPDRDTV